MIAFAPAILGPIFPWCPPDRRVADHNDATWNRWTRTLTRPGRWVERSKRHGTRLLRWVQGGIWKSVTNTTSSSPASSTTQTLTFPGAVTSGDALVCATRQGTGTTTTCADSVNAGNWNAIGATDNGAGRQYLFYRENTGAGTPTVTLTYATGSQTPRIIIGEVPGTIGASSFDQSATATDASGTSTAVSVTTPGLGQALETVVLATSAAANQTFTSSWGTVAAQEPAAASARLAIVYLDVNSTSAVTATATLSAASNWIAQVATFKLAGGGAPATTFLSWIQDDAS